MFEDAKLCSTHVSPPSILTQDEGESYDNYFDRVYTHLLSLNVASFYGSSYVELESGVYKKCVLLVDDAPTFAEDARLINGITNSTISVDRHY